jgi:hypothetical protein
MDYRRPRKPPPAPKPPERPPAVSELMKNEFKAKEFGIAGEWATPGPHPPPPPIPQPFRPPPPDWDAEMKERREFERAAEEEQARKVLADKAKREDER